MRLTIVTPPTHHNLSLLLKSQPIVVTYPRFCPHIFLPTLLTPLLSRKLPPQGPFVSRCPQRHPWKCLLCQHKGFQRTVLEILIMPRNQIPRLFWLMGQKHQFQVERWMWYNVFQLNLCTRYVSSISKSLCKKIPYGELHNFSDIPCINVIGVCKRLCSTQWLLFFWN